MQRDVWLDNVINLRQYILRYTVGNPTSLRNVAFHWLTSEYAAGKRFYAAGSRWANTRNKVHFHCLFEEKMLIVH